MTVNWERVGHHFINSGSAVLLGLGMSAQRNWWAVAACGLCLLWSTLSTEVIREVTHLRQYVNKLELEAYNRSKKNA